MGEGNSEGRRVSSQRVLWAGARFRGAFPSNISSVQSGKGKAALGCHPTLPRTQRPQGSQRIGGPRPCGGRLPPGQLLALGRTHTEHWCRNPAGREVWLCPRALTQGAPCYSNGGTGHEWEKLFLPLSRLQMETKTSFTSANNDLMWAPAPCGPHRPSSV